MTRDELIEVAAKAEYSFWNSDLAWENAPQAGQDAYKEQAERHFDAILTALKADAADVDGVMVRKFNDAWHAHWGDMPDEDQELEREGISAALVAALEEWGR